MQMEWLFLFYFVQFLPSSLFPPLPLSLFSHPVFLLMAEMCIDKTARAGNILIYLCLAHIQDSSFSPTFLL